MTCGVDSMLCGVLSVEAMQEVNGRHIAFTSWGQDGRSWEDYCQHASPPWRSGVVLHHLPLLRHGCRSGPREALAPDNQFLRLPTARGVRVPVRDAHRGALHGRNSSLYLHRRHAVLWRLYQRGVRGYGGSVSWCGWHMCLCGKQEDTQE